MDAAIFPRRRDGQPTMYHPTDLQYNKQGELWFVTRRHWEAGDEYCEQQVIDQILEVRGSGRARYVARERDPAAFDWIVPDTAVWSDYDGDTIYGDYTAEWVEVEPDVWELEVEDRTAYLPGIGQRDNATGEVMYTHGDQVGSLRAVTRCTVGAGECIPGETASVLQRPVYTAFGELVYDLAPQDTFIRYRYAGDWGYEGRLGSETNGGSDLALRLPYTHVGHRWYDPSTGRFLQRDPIGIEGGWNTYEYVGSSPVRTADPLGLDQIMRTKELVRLIDAESTCAGSVLVRWRSEPGGPHRYYKVRHVLEYPPAPGGGNRTEVVFITDTGEQFEYAYRGEGSQHRVDHGPGIIRVEPMGDNDRCCGVTGLEALPVLLIVWLQIGRQRLGSRTGSISTL